MGRYVADLIKKGKIAIKKLSSSAKSSIKTILKQNCCFVAGTLVSTPEGKKTIENIKKGDKVYSQNPETGEIGIKEVTNAFVRETTTLYYIQTEYEEIVTTAEHPFWVKDIGWIEASQLTSGNVLCLQDGKIRL